MLKTKPARFSESVTESVYSPTAKVDRANKVIRHVKILGRDSRNQREYTAGARTEAAALYEGMSVNLNHPDKTAIRRSRGIEEKWGWLENVSNEADGVYGDLHYLDKHQYTPQLLELAERNPRQFGLSHNADVVGHRSGRKEVIESVEKVRSVDVVQRPATTNSLFESVSVFEMDGMADFGAAPNMGPGPDAQADDAEPDDVTGTDDAATLADIQTVIDDMAMSAEEQVAGIKAILSGASRETDAVAESYDPRRSGARSALAFNDAKSFAAAIRGPSTSHRTSTGKSSRRISLVEQIQGNVDPRSALTFTDAKSFASQIR